MLKWYKKLYIGDNAKKKAPAVIKKVNQGKLQFDCLLYTSPSPRDATLSRMPSSA